MKKSYHSSEVPTKLATMTRRTDEGWMVPASDVIGVPSLTTSGRSCSSTDRTTSLRNRAIDGVLTEGGTKSGSATGDPVTPGGSLSTLTRTMSRHEVVILIAVGTRARSPP